MTKRRYIGPNGGVFVPNVDEATVAVMVAAGEWREIPPSPVVDRPVRRKPQTRKKVADASSSSSGDDV